MWLSFLEDQVKCKVSDMKEQKNNNNPYEMRIWEYDNQNKGCASMDLSL